MLGPEIASHAGPDNNCCSSAAYSSHAFPSSSTYPPSTSGTSSLDQPPLPEKRRQGTLPGSPNGMSGTLKELTGHPPSGQHHVTFSPLVGELTLSELSEGTEEGDPGSRVSVKFVQDSSRFWYKPGISREQGESENMFQNV